MRIGVVTLGKYFLVIGKGVIKIDKYPRTTDGGSRIMGIMGIQIGGRGFKFHSISPYLM